VVYGEKAQSLHGAITPSVSYQEVKSQFGLLEAVDELGLTWGPCSKSQHALCYEKVEKHTLIRASLFRKVSSCWHEKT